MEKTEEEGEEGAVGVDLDQADFGYCVGEIEILVPDGGDIQAALRRIEKTADKLGEDSLMSHTGEFSMFVVSVFIMRPLPCQFCPPYLPCFFLCTLP